jgi:anti-sigma factor ChrR (cupin superfamily)
MLDLANIPWQWTRHEGIGLHVLQHDKQTGDAAVLIFMRAGAAYPAHRHVGEEHVLVLQGAYEDGHATYQQGTYHTHAAGSAHAPRALESGDCVLFAIAHGGIELLR